MGGLSFAGRPRTVWSDGSARGGLGAPSDRILWTVDPFGRRDLADRRISAPPFGGRPPSADGVVRDTADGVLRRRRRQCGRRAASAEEAVQEALARPAIG